ncbi:MAG TPA: T9SS type A sorting domain-containing protein, partial [Bacteroidia bacterium]|nr:T9SS type A sorting domain-containing protein [Bacteroidia bacterium]
AYGAGTYNAYTFHLGYDNFLPTAIDDPGKNEMELFVTNPVKDKIQITGNQFTGNIQIKLYTLPGQILFEKDFRNVTATIEIDVSGFSKGIYLLEAISENGRTVKKIVKQ